MSNNEFNKFVNDNYVMSDTKVTIKKPPNDFQQLLMEYAVFPAAILKYARFVSKNTTLLTNAEAMNREVDDDDDRNVSTARFGFYGVSSNRIERGDSEKTKLIKKIRHLGEKDVIPTSWIGPALSLVSSSTDPQVTHMNPLGLILGYGFLEAGRQSYSSSSSASSFLGVFVSVFVFVFLGVFVHGFEEIYKGYHKTMHC